VSISSGYVSQKKTRSPGVVFFFAFFLPFFIDRHVDPVVGGGRRSHI
jgi:hypothetical protein